MRKTKRKLRAFTLVELLVSMAIFAVIIVLVVQMLGQTQKVAEDVTSKVSKFKEARAAFDGIIQRLSQATLNTYWDYDNPNRPTDYVAQSELHFVTGEADELLSSGRDVLSRAVFFQAPLGFSTQRDYREFSNLLNAWGYYIEYGSGDEYMPGFMAQHPNYAPRYRHRLMEFRQPAEELEIYQEDRQSGDYTRWYQDNDARSNRILAENIILLVVQPMRSEADQEDFDEPLAPNYEFDSRLNEEYRHQLPPVIRITMVAIGEITAVREGFGANVPALYDTGLFQNVDRYDDDLQAVESALDRRKINYRIFSTSIPMQSAKWKAPSGESS